MPLLWRYLLSHYLKVFILCVVSFIAILLTLKLEEIAYFATLGPQAWHVFWFAVQQIPYVLPIALPVSALISSVLLVQNLSQSRELTAMRSCGFSLKDVLAPVIAASLFLSAFNFYAVSELSTTSHFNANRLKNQMRSLNPLLLLNNKLLMRIKGLYFDALGSSHVGEFAQDIIFLSPNKQSDRLTLMAAKRIDVKQSIFSGDYITLLTSQQSKDGEADHLVVENMQRSTTTIEDFSEMMEKGILVVNHDHLSLPKLLVRKNEAYLAMNALIASQAPSDQIKEARHYYYRAISEIIRRISVGLAVFSFTLMGLSFGINISRSRSSRRVLIVIAFAALYLMAFFIAKSFDHSIAAAASFSLLPHVLIFVASLWMLRRVSRGVE